MQLILGLSKNNFIAKSENDDMSWLKADKNVFRLLSATNGGICFISRKSGLLMPDTLPGRKIIKLSKLDYIKYPTLELAYTHYPNANLLGGQTLALEAINKNYITDIFLTYSPIELESGIKFNLDKIIEEKFNKVQKITIDGVVVYHWKKK
jgi:dihydrofolate reductase